MERVLAEKIHGPAERGFSYIIGRKSLRDALASYKDKPKYQRLYIEFETGEDPDDAYSTVPYEKGANFILHLGQARSHLSICFRLTRDVKSARSEGSKCFCHTSRTTCRATRVLPSQPRYGVRLRVISCSDVSWSWSGEHLYKYFREHGGDEKIKALDSVDWDVSTQQNIYSSHNL
jgi:leukotriene-A4 hydrolase